MSAQPVTATIFAYQVGFGDCFLVRFTYDDEEKSRRHLLIDFGTTGLPETAAKSQMMIIANDIAAKCKENGGALDIVVATHRHADHISGFSTGDDGEGPGSIIAALKPKVVVQPWTEAPEAPEDWLGPDPDADGQAFAARRASLAAMHETAAAALAFLQQHHKGFAPAVARELAFIGQDNLANLSAVKNLQAMGKRNLFAFHGCDTGLEEELPNVGVIVLGPPTLRQTETIRTQRSRSKDEFWQMAALNLAKSVDVAKDGRLFPDARTIAGTKLYTDQRWLADRLLETNAEVTLSLVRALDAQMNNTSVILLLKAGKKKLLFPGDAQLENWQYALQSPLAGELDDVDLYKVGHHGSLNATPKSLWKRFAKKGPESKKGRLTSVMSTKSGKHGSEKKGTEVPRRPLVEELDANSTLYSTQTLTADQLYREVTIDLR